MLEDSANTFFFDTDRATEYSWKAIGDRSIVQKGGTMGATVGLDLVGAIRAVLAVSAKPLSLSGIRRALPVPLRSVPAEALAQVLRRQVAAHVVVLYPRYRSLQDRYWDRPLAVHLAQILRRILRAGPMTWSEIRRRLPGYAKVKAESILEEQIARGKLYRHPASGRLGPRYATKPPEPSFYLRPQLNDLLRRLECLGFSRKQLRASAFDFLQEEEWAENAREDSRIARVQRRLAFAASKDYELIADFFRNDPFSNVLQGGSLGSGESGGASSRWPILNF